MKAIISLTYIGVFLLLYSFNAHLFILPLKGETALASIGTLILAVAINEIRTLWIKGKQKGY